MSFLFQLANDRRALDAAFPRDPTLSLNHLRRFAKEDVLPDHLRSAAAALREQRQRSQAQQQQTLYVLISPPLPEISELQTVLAPFAPVPPPPPVVAEKNGDNDDDDETDPSTTCPTGPNIPILKTEIPLQPPLSPEQAARWSQTMWPVTYNPAAPRGMIAPPPQILHQAQESIGPRAGYYLSLAYRVADDAKRSGRGRGVGAVVVDPKINDDDTGVDDWARGVVAVAGDARYCAPGVPPELLATAEPPASSISELASRGYNPDLEGGPELHALMRAVAMVASRRRADDFEDTPVDLSSSGGDGPVHDPPLTPLESYFLYLEEEEEKANEPEAKAEAEPSPSNANANATANTSYKRKRTRNRNRILPRSQGGYLCTDLDIYLTHEPCLSCSMGMLLSRFRAVVFPRRGRMVTGGLASEPCTTSTAEQRERNYYGLHWRKELNWRALCFEFVEEDDQHKHEYRDEQHVAFHA